VEVVTVTEAEADLPQVEPELVNHLDAKAALELLAQVDPQYSQGRMQDGLGYLYFLARFPAVSTQVTCTCTGSSGTVIPAGAQAQDASGNIYSCVSGGVIGLTGSISLVFANTVPGPTACPAGALNSVYVAIPGWDSVTNSLAGTTGQNVEGSLEFEARRSGSVSINSIGQASSIRAAILASGSQFSPPNPPADAFVYENFTTMPAVVGGITVQPQSVFVATYGGDQQSIASAILSKKDVGCNYTGSAYFTASIPLNSSTMTVSAVASGTLAPGQWVLPPVGVPAQWLQIGSQVSGTLGGPGVYSLVTTNTTGAFVGTAFESAQVMLIPDTTYTFPQPNYAVIWTAARPTPINVQVTLAAASSPPGNALAQLQGASGLSTAFTGSDGGAPAGIGRTVYGSRFYQTINKLFPGTNIISVLVGIGTPASPQQTVNNDQYPVMGNITLVLA